LKLSVMIPVYNEADTIEEMLARVRRVELDKEIIVVDDCSDDGTRELLEKESGIKLIRHERNMGKGMAIRTALRHAIGDVVIIQDADLEYDPQDFHLMLGPIERGEADVVYGSRFLGRRPKMHPANYAANRILAAAPRDPKPEQSPHSSCRSPQPLTTPSHGHTLSLTIEQFLRS